MSPTTGNIAQFAPTHGALVLLVSNHTLMHSGQFTVVRRKLGKNLSWHLKAAWKDIGQWIA